MLWKDILSMLAASNSPSQREVNLKHEDPEISLLQENGYAPVFTAAVWEEYCTVEEDEVALSSSQQSPSVTSRSAVFKG